MSEERDSLGFLYRIGDTLAHRAELVAPASRRPSRLFVVERIQQECPGGVQRSYICRPVRAEFGTANVMAEYVRFNEVELCPLPPPVKDTAKSLMAEAKDLSEAITERMK